MQARSDNSIAALALTVSLTCAAGQWLSHLCVCSFVRKSSARRSRASVSTTSNAAKPRRCSRRCAVSTAECFCACRSAAANHAPRFVLAECTMVGHV